MYSVKQNIGGDHQRYVYWPLEVLLDIEFGKNTITNSSSYLMLSPNRL